jgi:hypothetical protein
VDAGAKAEAVAKSARRAKIRCIMVNSDFHKREYDGILTGKLVGQGCAFFLVVGFLRYFSRTRREDRELNFKTPSGNRNRTNRLMPAKKIVSSLPFVSGSVVLHCFQSQRPDRAKGRNCWSGMLFPFGIPKPNRKCLSLCQKLGFELLLLTQPKPSTVASLPES